MKELSKYNRNELEQLLFSFVSLLEDGNEPRVFKRIASERKILQRARIIDVNAPSEKPVIPYHNRFILAVDLHESDNDLAAFELYLKGQNFKFEKRNGARGKRAYKIETSFIRCAALAELINGTQFEK